MSVEADMEKVRRGTREGAAVSQTSDALRELGYTALAENVDELEARLDKAVEALKELGPFVRYTLGLEPDEDGWVYDVGDPSDVNPHLRSALAVLAELEEAT